MASANREEKDIREAVFRSLSETAPEFDVTTLKENEDLREAADLDSLDFLNFISKMGKILHRNIPEKDFASFRTLNSCLSYFRVDSQHSP